MKVAIIPEKCIACGLCQTYSGVFDYNDDGIVIFTDSKEKIKTVADDPNILMAVKNCPTKAHYHLQQQYCLQYRLLFYKLQNNQD